jgi:hypothetical protein
MVTAPVKGGGVEDPPLPPHPLSKPNPAMLTASRSSICRRRRFFQPMQQKAAANAASGNSGRRSRCSAADVAVADTVTVVVAVAPPEGVTVAGEKVHVSPAGNCEQVNETAEAKPPCGITETVMVPLCPEDSVSDVGAAVTEKSGGKLMVYAALATALLSKPGAMAIAFSVSEFATVIALLYNVELALGVVPSVV